MRGSKELTTADHLIAAAALGLALLGMLVSPEEAGAGAIILTIAQTAPLVYRRRAPVPVLTVVVGATVVYLAVGAPFVSTAFLGLTVALYALASYGSERSSRIGMAATAAAILVAVILSATPGRPVNVMDALVHVGLAGVAWVLGDRAKTRRAYTLSLEERANQAERERAMEAASAAAEERTRIARELHDVVAHSVSTMVLHASAANQVLDSDAEGARASLELIEDTGRHAMRELRTILQALRTEETEDDGAPLKPQPGVAAIDELAQRARSAGIEVEVTIEGSPRAIPSSVDLSAYRIVQEALTNTLKHSGARRAEVVVRFSDDKLLVHVTDDGRGPTETTDAGFGLAGMRERVELLEGRFQAGRRRDGGFEVLAVLPLTGRPA